MRILTAEIIADESGHPLKVQMDYDEFLRVKAEVEGTDARPDEAAAPSDDGLRRHGEVGRRSG